MGLIDLNDTRVVPDDNGGSVDLLKRVPPYMLEKALEATHVSLIRELGIKEIQKVGGLNGTITRQTIDMDVLAAQVVRGWSYDAPVTVENVQRLDNRKWLHDEVWEAARPRTDEEAEGNSASSSAT